MFKLKMWKNKLRVVSALCALVMSVSAIGPANAYSGDDVGNLESRLNSAENFMRNAFVSGGSEEQNQCFQHLAEAKNLFYTNKKLLLSDTNDVTMSIFNTIHADINNIYGKTNYYKQKLGLTPTEAGSIGLTSYRITNHILPSFVPNKHKYFDSNPLLKSKMKMVESRVYELNGRLSYIDAKLLYMKKNHQIFDETYDRLHNISRDISTDFMNNDFGPRAYGLPSDETSGLDDNTKRAHAIKVYNELMPLIDSAHAKVDSLLSKVEKLDKATSVMSEGRYNVHSKLNDGECLDIAGGSYSDGGNLQLFHSTGTSGQIFKLAYDIDNDGFRIYPECVYGKSLDVQSAAQYPGVNVQQWMNFDNAPSQLWRIADSGEFNYYNVISKCNNLCLDVEGGNSSDDTNVQCWTPNGTDAQKFRFQKL